MLVNNTSLAKTSSKPGKTKLINHFIINEEWYLVDLPGYGYAEVPKTEKQKLEKLIREFILNRNNLYCLFVLVDSRHEPQLIDLEFIHWLGINEVPFALVFTKADKLNERDLKENIGKYREKLLKTWEQLPECFIASTKRGQGRQEILNYMAKIIRD
jgi:GTP-binding protein